VEHDAGEEVVGADRRGHLDLDPDHLASAVLEHRVDLDVVVVAVVAEVDELVGPRGRRGGSDAW
jgi:hypothetical protein